MERGSSKHGPRLDEQLDQEVRGETQGRPGGRAQEWHQPEPPGEDQPDATELLSGTKSNEVSRLGRYIGLAALPGDREALRRSAEMLNAPDDILIDLDRLPKGVVFDTVADVRRALDHNGG